MCRSTELFGPYLNKSGDNMNDNKHEVLIHRNDAFLGTGHNAEIVKVKIGLSIMLTGLPIHL